MISFYLDEKFYTNIHNIQISNSWLFGQKFGGNASFTPLDDSTAGNQCILDNSNNPPLNEVSIRLSSCFLNIVTINDLTI